MSLVLKSLTLLAVILALACGGDKEVPASSGGAGGGDDTESSETTPASFTELRSWYRVSDISGVSDGGAVTAWSNQATNSSWNLVSVGGAGTYYDNPASLGFPSVFLCGKDFTASTCQGSSHSRGTQLRLGSSLSNYEVWLGSDRVDGSSTGGSSFTVLAIAARVNGNEAPIVFNRDGNAASSKGVYFGWQNDTTFRFSSTGKSAGVTATVPAFTSSKLKMLAGVFDRTGGHTVYIDGTKAAEATGSTNGGNITDPLIPTMGYRQGNSNYGVHVFEYVEINRALTENELCKIHEYANKQYSLGLTIDCT